MMIMSSIATESNSHRLGGNEAPPAILSVFCGSTLNNILDSIEERISDKALTPDEKTGIKLDIGKIPEILLDNTVLQPYLAVRFYGQPFRASCDGFRRPTAPMPLIVLNTAVAEQLTLFKTDVDALLEKGVKKDEAILQTIRKFIIESKSIRFEGNGYSEDWHKEAAGRGLRGITSVTSAIREYIAP